MHAVQLVAFVDPGGELMAPIGQTLHGTVETLLYWPAAHTVHEVALVAVNVFVIDPGPHMAHGVEETLLYWPAAQAVQRVAAAEPRVSVTLPLGQCLQPVWPALPWYWPTPQSTQGEVGLGDVRPAAHAVQFVAPPVDLAQLLNPGQLDKDPLRSSYVLPHWPASCVMPRQSALDSHAVRACENVV